MATWHRHHPGFPRPVAGADTSPRFDTAAVELWLHRHGKTTHHHPGTPAEPAVLTLPDGTTVTLNDPTLRRDDVLGVVELDGFSAPDAWVPLHHAVLTRVQVPGQPDLSVSSASADVFDSGSSRHIALIWRQDCERTWEDAS
ncbi:hypothetical protein [Kitasatospora sp. NPDC004531]